MAHARKVDNDIIQTAAVKDKDARARTVAGVVRQRRLRADKERAFYAGLVPRLGGAVKGVDDGVGGYAEDAMDGGDVALEHGDVELGVVARRRRLVWLVEGGCVGFVV